MKFKLFGLDLFEATKSGSNPKSIGLYNNGLDRLKASDFLIDFYKDTGGNRGSESWGNIVSDYVITSTSSGGAVAVPVSKGKNAKDKKTAKPKAADKPLNIELTPKGVYQMKMLNDESFTIKVEPEYVDQQIETFKEKLGMIKTSEFDMDRGTIEIGSILGRMENRKKYEDHKTFYEEFPYTTTSKISELIQNHNYLKLGQVEQFLADMPKEAVDAMKRYKEETKKLCDKKPIFYIIANKKDFEKTEKRRDPILLAQSPFGHFWQILGAWDEEMLLLEEL